MEQDGFSAEQVEAAIERLSEPGRMAEAEAIVGRAAPQLQQLLIGALEAGGWFEEAHTEQLNAALALPGEEERARGVRTVLAEETRIAMMIGVSAGWALNDQLRRPDTATEEE